MTAINTTFQSLGFQKIKNVPIWRCLKNKTQFRIYQKGDYFELYKLHHGFEVSLMEFREDKDLIVMMSLLTQEIKCD